MENNYHRRVTLLIWYFISWNTQNHFEINHVIRNDLRWFLEEKTKINIKINFILTMRCISLMCACKSLFSKWEKGKNDYHVDSGPNTSDSAKLKEWEKQEKKRKKKRKEKETSTVEIIALAPIRFSVMCTIMLDKHNEPDESAMTHPRCGCCVQIEMYFHGGSASVRYCAGISDGNLLVWPGEKGCPENCIKSEHVRLSDYVKSHVSSYCIMVELSFTPTVGPSDLFIRLFFYFFIFFSLRV